VVNCDAAEPPVIAASSPGVVKAALGRSASLQCRAFGAPTPLISWSRGDDDDHARESWTAEQHDNETSEGGGQDTAARCSVDSVTSEGGGQGTAARFSIDNNGTLIIQVSAVTDDPHNVLYTEVDAQCVKLTKTVVRTLTAAYCQLSSIDYGCHFIIPSASTQS